MITDLERAYKALSGKINSYTTAMSYYDGDQPTVYSTDRLREAFGNIKARFVQNWVKVVVDAPLDRLVMSGWDAQDTASNDALDTIWSTLNLYRDAVESHRDALVTHEAFIIAWKDGDNVDVYHNDPRMVHVFYDPERPKVKKFAAKWWSDGEAYRMTLYYPDRLEYYIARSKDMPSSANAFEPAEQPTAPNPYGIIPVFHFDGESELNSITDLQDAVNKLFADMMVSAEFGAFKQRWVISNADTSALKNAPNEIWEVPAGDGQGQQTSVGQFDATPLDNYLKAISDIASTMAIISRTPKHYFYSTGANLSGEALLAMEAPLTKKVKHYQELYGTTWRELGAFLLRLTKGTVIDPAEITPVWMPAESLQPLTEAQTLKENTAAGVPLETALKWIGKTQTDIDEMQKAKQAEQKEATAYASLLLERERISQEQNNNPQGNNSNTENE